MTTMNAPPGTLMQFDFCVKESQRLADLIGIKIDLETAQRYCDLHIEIDPTERGITGAEMRRRDDTRQGLCRAALVMYGRAWGWGAGVRSGLGTEYVARLSPDAASLHGVVKPLRDKWVAHAVNHFDDVRVKVEVGVTAAGVYEVRGVSTLAHTVTGFLQAWMIQFRSLISEVLSHVDVEIRAESERLSVRVRETPIEEILKRKPIDTMTLGQPNLQPKKVRKKFSD